MKARAMKRAIAVATRVVSDDKGNCNGNKGGGQATATRTVVGDNEGSGNGNEDGGKLRG